MSGRKTATLQPRGRTRAAARRKVTLRGKCGIAGRPAEDVLVTDLGSHGCSIQGDAVGVTKSAPLELWLGPVGPLAARIKWAKAGTLGIAFASPIEQDLLDELYDAGTSEKVVQLRTAPSA